MIKKDTWTQWRQKISGEGLYFYFESPRRTTYYYQSYMGAIIGLLQEGLALRVLDRTALPDKNGPQIRFLKSGAVELQFDIKTFRPEDAIVLSRKEAWGLVKAVQQHFENLAIEAKIEQDDRGDGDEHLD